MFEIAIGAGVLAIFLGLVVLFLGSNSRGSMDIERGSFKGPAWFLLFIIGIILIAFGYL